MSFLPASPVSWYSSHPEAGSRLSNPRGTKISQELRPREEREAGKKAAPCGLAVSHAREPARSRLSARREPSAWSEGRGRPVRPGGPAPPCGQRQTGASETPSGRMRPAAGTEHPLRGAEYSGAESVARGSLLSDHAVDVSDELCAVSFLQLVGIKINNCLIFEEKFRDELRSTGSPPSSTTLASHRQKLVSGTSRSVRRAGSALLRQSRCLSKHRPLRGRGTRFSPSPLCVKTVRVTQCRTEEQLVGPSLTQGGGGVWHPRRGPCQERTTRWDFTSWEAAAQRRGARRAQDTGAGCRGARRGPPFMRRQDHTAVPSRPPEGPVGAASAAHTKRETAQSTFSRDSRGFSLRCQGP